MSHCVKVMLLLVVMVSMSAAQFKGNSCLCQDLRPTIASTRVREIQVYAPSLFCSNTEIVVTENSGNRYCLNPNSRQIQMLLHHWKQKNSSDASPTQSTTTGV